VWTKQVLEPLRESHVSKAERIRHREGHRILRSGSSGKLVLVNQATQHVAPPDADAVGPRSRNKPPIRRLQTEASMRSASV